MRNFLLLIFFVYTSFCCLNAQQNNLSSYNSAMSNKYYEGAVTIMTNIMEDQSLRNSENYYKRALAYSMCGKYTYAIADCTSSLICDSNNSKAYFLRGKCKLEFGDPTYVGDLRLGGDDGIALLKKQNINNEYIEEENQYASITSDVDINIPGSSPNTRNRTFVLIFSNERYTENDISSVSFARRDGEIFGKYCIQTLGIPEENIHIKFDATKNQMRSEIKWIRSIADAFGEEANVIFYYSGHGMPDEESRKAYLLPSDGIANDPESAYSLSSLYTQLGSLHVKSVVVFLDACFSGSSRNGEMMMASRGVAIRPKEEALNGRLVVFSASQGDETAYQYNEKGHGLFTYFLLKKMQESNGNTTLYDLGQYIVNNVRQTSVLRNKKKQTPAVCVSSALDNIWENWKLK